MSAHPNLTITDINSRLPPVSEFRLMPWSRSYGGDYYGALKVAAKHCGLGEVPERYPGNWQHGTWPPWQKIQPEVLVYGAPKSSRCFVARPDEVVFLKEGGYRDVRAIGLPIIYTQPSGLERIPNSLLVMPTHSLVTDVIQPPTSRYISEIESIRNRFNFVAACVSAQCIARGMWVDELARRGIPVIRGAGIDDANALARMRALFESFEYVTTDTYGSHVSYALYFGAKVSIWGTATPALRENVLSDGAWAPFPEAVDKLFSEETARREREYLKTLRTDPWNGVLDVSAGKLMLGHEKKLTPREMRQAFRWTPFGVLTGVIRQRVRSSQVWRAGSAAKRRLFANAKG